MLKKNHGFTLIEILVVVVIISITMGFALMAFGDFGNKRRMLVSAEQFTHDIKLVQQQALLEGSVLGIAFNQQSYNVLTYSQTNGWQPFKARRLHARSFPKGVHIHLEKNQKKRFNPDIVINTSGELSPFTLQLSTSSTSIVKIIGKIQGDVSITSATS